MPHNTVRDAARRKRRKRRRKKKGRTWAEAARTVLEKYHNTPMSHKEILQVIQKEGLKEISGTSPLACLNAMLHTNSRGEEGMFYKVPGRMGVYTLKKDVADVVKELSDCSEDSSEAQSDSQGSEHSTSSSSSNKDRRGSCWKRKVTSRVSQPSSPQPSCPSPPIPAGKVISPSQKLSKKALKQALKQQQQRKKQQRRAVMPVATSQHLLLKTVKSTGNIAASKSAPAPTWTAKRSEVQPRTQQISAPASNLPVKSNESLHGLGKKALQRSSRLRDSHLKRTKCAEIDVETPESILVNTNLRALINKHTFSLLPADCQQRLLRLLPEVDQPAGSDGLLKLNNSALNNEFFTSASQSWKERLAEGEFTPEMQLRIRQEIEKEKKVEPWKEQFYESYYGENSGLTMEEFSDMTAEDDDIKAQMFPSVEHIEAKPERKSLDDHPTVKVENDQKSPLKSHLSEVTEAIPPPENPVTGTTVKADSIKDSEMAEENKLDGSVEKMTQTTDTTCESIDTESTSHTCVTPSEPKSPDVVQLPTTPTTTESLPQDSSGAETPEESPEKEEASPISGAKRRLDIDESSLASPEKSPRLMTPSQSPQPFRALCKPYTETAQQTAEQKVPPLKIPMAWITQKPLLASQVSHRAPYPATGNSPGRTGARTLADIKAKAQLARAKRAAAAAAHGGSVPGPGPGGGAVPGGDIDESRKRILDLGSTGSGRSERRTSAPQPASQNQGQVKVTGQASAYGATRAQLLQKPCIQPRISTTTSFGSTRFFPTSERDIATTIKNQNPFSVTVDKNMIVPGGSGLGTLAHHCEHIKAESTKGMLADGSDLKIPATKSSSDSQLASVASPVSFTANRCSSKLRTSLPAQGNDKTLLRQSSDISAKSQRLATCSGQSTRSSSSIPANNPLVTQLLQGKNVPLDQILPRPLTKVEMKTLPLSSSDQPASASTVQVVESCRKENMDKTSHTAAQQLERFLSHNRQHPSGQRILELFSGKNLSNPFNTSVQGSVASNANQEQILQFLVKKVWQENSVNASSPPEMNGSASQNENNSQRFMLGFAGRRASKPAMSGHYLLNLSTYGRAPEPFRRTQFGSSEAETSLNYSDCLGNANDETESVTESSEEGIESEESMSECATSAVKVESGNQVSSLKSENLCNKNTKVEQFQTEDLKEKVQIITKDNTYSGANIARDLAKMANVLGVRLKQNTSDMFGMHTTSVGLQHHHPEPGQTSRTNGNSAGLLGSSYGGTINISTSPDGLHRSSLPTGGDFTSSNADNIVSFSVTVTTIPSSHSGNSGCPDQPISVQAYTDDNGMELSPSKCYCRLKAMIMCKGCGAFCHDDCIGPSKLCVSCLVVR
ncbi:putative Polycomb group protein ASXL2 isoform X1 [Aquarana catesbeiana]|uniref:putative Polycomb group protein ASXL2 isoform X1 n=1 Tax=Aquarana catesbeiana TaxID=8400 RepID=UPI003CC96ACB